MQTVLTAPVAGYGQMLARLEKLRNKGGELTYERVGIAAGLMRDDEWLASQFGGDQHAAKEYLEAEFFGDLCGSVTLGEWLVILREFPEKADWQKFKYNVRRMWAEYRERAQKAKKQESPDEESGEPRSRRAATLKELSAEVEKRKEVEYVANKLKGDLESKEDRLSALERENVALKLENAELKGRLKELERQMSLRPAS